MSRIIAGPGAVPMDGVLPVGDRAFQAMVEHVAVGVALVSPNGRILHANRRLCEMLGFSLPEFIGKSIGDITHPDDVTRDLRLLDELVRAERTSYSLEKRYFHASGRIVWGRLTVSVVQSDNGKPEYLIGMVEDVSELRQLSHAVGERVKELNALHELSRRLMARDSNDLQQMLQTVSDILRPAFQYPERMAVRVTLGSATACTPGFVEGQPTLATSWAGTHDHGSIEVCFVDVAGLNEADLFLREERALIDSVGDLLRIAADRLHVTNERERAENALRESEERLQIAVEAARIGIIEWDLEARQATISPDVCQIFAFAEGTTQVTDSQFRERIYPDDRDEVRRAFTSEADGGDARDLQYRLLLPNGLTRWIATRGRVFFDAQGKATRRISIVVDITSRQLLEEQYRHSQKMEAVGRLAGGVAHDFNNLLTVIGAAAEFARADTARGTQVHADIQDILDAVGRARSLTSQLLTFSRRQVVRLARVSLNDVVLNSEKMLRRLIGADVALNFAMQDALEPVIADTGQLEQVLVNLIVNARDAMPEGGAISIATSMVTLDRAAIEFEPELVAGQFVQLTVSDTGMGMDEATRARIFEPFFTTKEAGRGTGLGLATVFGIVKQAGGHVSVSSEQGTGSSFRILLPLAPSNATGIVAVASPEAAAGDGHETILLVEDEPHVRLLARRMLVERGYDVLEAGSSSEAFEMASRHGKQIDLLITDIVLPDHNGRELAEALVVVHPRLRVLYMSGYTPDALLHHRINESGAPFIEKPFTREGLSAAVRAALKSAPLAFNQDSVVALST